MHVLSTIICCIKDFFLNEKKKVILLFLYDYYLSPHLDKIRIIVKFLFHYYLNVCFRNNFTNGKAMSLKTPIFLSIMQGKRKWKEKKNETNALKIEPDRLI